MHTKTELSVHKFLAIKKADENIRWFQRNRAQGGSDYDIHAAIIRNPEKKVVVGLWGDNSEPDYCGMLILKGAIDLSDFEAVCFEDMDAIHCAGAEHATALRQMFGDGAEALQLTSILDPTTKQVRRAG